MSQPILVKLFDLVYSGRLEDIQALNLDSLTLQNARDVRHNNCPLIYTAARQNHIDIVIWLLEQHGVDVNSVQATGSTALHAAAYNGHYQLCKVSSGLVVINATRFLLSTGQMLA